MTALNLNSQCGICLLLEDAVLADAGVRLMVDLASINAS